jgi:hypothetical protein
MTRAMPNLAADVFEGPFLGSKTGEKFMVTLFDSVNDTLGHEGILTHGDEYGRLMIQHPNGGMFMARTSVTGQYFGKRLASLRRGNPALRDMPQGELTLFARHGDDSRSGQVAANVLNRDVRCFYRQCVLGNGNGYGRGDPRARDARRDSAVLWPFQKRHSTAVSHGLGGRGNSNGDWLE